MANDWTQCDNTFIARFENQTSPSDFTVTVHADTFDNAHEYTKEYFSLLRVSYVESDFDGNHSFKVTAR
jgi:hypothetical protein